MIKYMYKKCGMTTLFDEQGKALSVTVLKPEPTKIVRHESIELNRKMIVVSYGEKARVSRGWIVPDYDKFAVNESLPQLEIVLGCKISAQGVSKGKGFQDAMTRHGFSGGPASHGSRFHRAPGSVGMRTEPGRTPKGKRLPGHMGDATVTVKNLKVVDIQSEKGHICVLGAVPGPTGSHVFVSLA